MNPTTNQPDHNPTNSRRAMFFSVGKRFSIQFLSALDGQTLASCQIGANGFNYCCKCGRLHIYCIITMSGKHEGSMAEKVLTGKERA